MRYIPNQVFNLKVSNPPLTTTVAVAPFHTADAGAEAVIKDLYIIISTISMTTTASYLLAETKPFKVCSLLNVRTAEVVLSITQRFHL